MGARGVASAPLALGARPARFARRSRVEGSLRSGLRGARPGAFGPLPSNFGSKINIVQLLVGSRGVASAPLALAA
jgi:hypothetical protein